MEKKMFAIDPKGEVNRSEVLRIVNQFGYSRLHDQDFISRGGFNTIYFVGNKWTNWTPAKAKEEGFTIISGYYFVASPETYLDRLF